MLALAAATDPQPALDAAEVRWAQTGLSNYRFHVRRSCFCPNVYTRGYRVDVVRGDAYDAPRWIKEIDTVPKLFAVIQEQIDGDGEVTAEYDEKTGLPTSISADPVPRAVDDEFGITAGGLAVGSADPRPVANAIEDGTAAEALAGAKARWDARGLTRYRYRTRRSCAGCASRTRTVRVLDGRRPPVFGLIARAIRGRVSTLTVRYGKGGLPRVVVVKADRRRADGGFSQSAFHLRRLP